jgi:hypothetical protein
VLAAILRPRSFKLASDSTAPATGTFGYTSGYFETASVSVTFTKGTDGGSGLNTTSGEEAAHYVLSEHASTTAAEIAAQSLAKAASADAILVHDRYNRVGPAVGYRLSHSKRSRQDVAT